MKKYVLYMLLFAMLLSVVSCNDVTNTTEPSEETVLSESVSESEAFEGYVQNIEKAKRSLEMIRMNEGRIFVPVECKYALSRLNSFRDFYAEIGGTFDPIRDVYFVYDDMNEPVFPTYEQAMQIQTGLFINEVYELLGAPHLNAEYPHGAAVIFMKPHDRFTMYVLDDGVSVLFLRYSKMYYKEKYEKSEWGDRVPDGFDETMTQWWELSSAEIISIDEFAELNIAEWDEEFATPNEFKDR